HQAATIGANKPAAVEWRRLRNSRRRPARVLKEGDRPLFDQRRDRRLPRLRPESSRSDVARMERSLIRDCREAPTPPRISLRSIRATLSDLSQRDHGRERAVASWPSIFCVLWLA